MNSRLLLPSLILLSLCTAQVASSSVTLTYGFVESAVVNYGTYGSDYDSFNGLENVTTEATLSGFRSMTKRTYENGKIRMDFEQSRSGELYDYAYGYSITRFVAEVDTPYSVSGNFTNSVGYTNMRASIYDHSVGGLVFDSDLHNSAEAPYSAVVGGTDGNWGYNLAGSVSGMLLAGNEYHFFTYALTQAYLDADDGATASGSFTLQFGDPDVEMVPEPASIAVWSCLGLGSVGMTVMRRRNRGN